MITSVDDESRHRDLPVAQAQIDVEKKQIADRRDADVEARAQKLETDLAELEAEGAKGDARRKVRESAEREMNQIRAPRRRRDRAPRRRSGTGSRSSRSPDLEGDEVLYRELRDRFGLYFEGGMGAAAIQTRLESFDLEAEAESLREIIAHRQGPAQDPRPQAPQGRLGLPHHAQLARWAWCSTASR